jgi:integrase
MLHRWLSLLAVFTSLRRGEAIALRRCDLDLEAGTVRIRAAFTERPTGQIVLGAPKSRAGRRIVGIPRTIIPALREHLSTFVAADPVALVFPGPRAGRCGAGPQPASVLATCRARDQRGRPAFS